MASQLGTRSRVGEARQTRQRCGLGRSGRGVGQGDTGALQHGVPPGMRGWVAEYAAAVDDDGGCIRYVQVGDSEAGAHIPQADTARPVAEGRVSGKQGKEKSAARARTLPRRTDRRSPDASPLHEHHAHLVCSFAGTRSVRLSLSICSPPARHLHLRTGPLGQPRRPCDRRPRRPHRRPSRPRALIASPTRSRCRTMSR